MKKSYIIAIVAVVLIAAIAFAAPSIMGMFAKMDPADHLAYAFMQSNDVKATNATMEMTMSLDKDAALELGILEGSEDPEAMANYVNSILENVTVEYDMTVASDEKQMPTYLDYKFGALYKEKELIMLDMVFEPWTFAIGSEQLYDKNFAFDIQDALEQALNEENIDMEDIDLDKYMAIILDDSDDLYKTAMDNTEAYETLIMDYLKANIVALDDGTLTIDYNGKTEDVKVSKYQLPLDMQTYMAKLQELITIYKNDTHMQALVKDRVFKVVNTFIESGDYALVGMELAEVEEMRAELEANYDTEMAMMLDEMINVYGSADADMAEMGMDITYNMIFSIDQDNMLRGMEMDVLSGFIRMNQVVTYNAFDDDVVIGTISTDNSVDLMALAEDEAMAMEISQEVMGNAFTNILSGEAFNTLMTDMEVNAEMLPETERAQVVEGIQGTLQMLPFLLQGGM